MRDSHQFSNDLTLFLQYTIYYNNIGFYYSTSWSDTHKLAFAQAHTKKLICVRMK